MRLCSIPLCVWMFAVVFACVYATHADAQTALGRPLKEVQSALGKILGCTEWWGDENSPGCVPGQTGYSTDLDRDPADGTVKTVETGGVLEWGDKRVPKQGFLTRRAMHRVFDYLFPHWAGRDRWLDQALCDARARKRSVKKLGNLTILVEPELPADLPLVAAGIFVTKRPSVDQWMDGGNDDYASGGPLEGRCGQKIPSSLL